MMPVQIRVPDPASAEFIAEARRQSLVVANSPDDQETMDFLADMSAGTWDVE